MPTIQKGKWDTKRSLLLSIEVLTPFYLQSIETWESSFLSMLLFCLLYPFGKRDWCWERHEDFIAHSGFHISCCHCQWYFSRFLSIFQILTFLWADIQLQIRPSVITHQNGSVKCGYSIQHEGKKQNMKEISDISDLWLIMVKPEMCLPYRKI